MKNFEQIWNLARYYTQQFLKDESSAQSQPGERFAIIFELAEDLIERGGRLVVVLTLATMLIAKCCVSVASAIQETQIALTGATAGATSRQETTSALSESYATNNNAIDTPGEISGEI